MDLQATDYGAYICPDDPGEPTTDVRRISVTNEEAALLAWLAHGLTVVELGTGLGVSTRSLALHAARVHTVDPDPWVWENVHPHLPPQVTTWQRRTPLTFMPGLVFIDADHTTEAVADDVAWALKATESGGMIVCHDANMAEVDAALDDTWIRVATHHGLALKIV